MDQHVRGRNTQCGLLCRSYARRLRRDHRLAAIVSLICRIAGHGAAALHRLLISGHGSEAVSKLQRKECRQRQNQECHSAIHLLKL